MGQGPAGSRAPCLECLQPIASALLCERSFVGAGGVRRGKAGAVGVGRAPACAARVAEHGSST